jgi:hypothetical protein
MFQVSYDSRTDFQLSHQLSQNVNNLISRFSPVFTARALMTNKIIINSNMKGPIPSSV